MLKVGHRGARAYEPENTLRSFKKALELVVNSVELMSARVKHKNAVKSATDLKANYLLPLCRFTHSEDIQKARQNGLKVIIWTTISKPEEVADYVEKGVMRV